VRMHYKKRVKVGTRGLLLEGKFKLGGGFTILKQNAPFIEEKKEKMLGRGEEKTGYEETRR